jgi:hypothetical protein
MSLHVFLIGQRPYGGYGAGYKQHTATENYTYFSLKCDGYTRETICEENGHTFAVTSRGIIQPPQHSVRVHQPAETVKQPK